jgi:hypothetical protein
LAWALISSALRLPAQPTSSGSAGGHAFYPASETRRSATNFQGRSLAAPHFERAGDPVAAGRARRRARALAGDEGGQRSRRMRQIVKISRDPWCSDIDIAGTARRLSRVGRQETRTQSAPGGCDGSANLNAGHWSPAPTNGVSRGRIHAVCWALVNAGDCINWCRGSGQRVPCRLRDQTALHARRGRAERTGQLKIIYLRPGSCQRMCRRHHERSPPGGARQPEGSTSAQTASARRLRMRRRAVSDAHGGRRRGRTRRCGANWPSSNQPDVRRLLATQRLLVIIGRDLSLSTAATRRDGDDSNDIASSLSLPDPWRAHARHFVLSDLLSSGTFVGRRDRQRTAPR